MVEPWQIVGALTSAVVSLAGLIYKGMKDVIADRDKVIAELKAENATLKAEAKETVVAKNREIERLWQLVQPRSTSEPRP